MELFLKTGNVENRIRDEYPADDHQPIRECAQELARSFGRTIRRDEAEDSIVVNELVDLSITLAPHVKLDSMMKEAVAGADRPLSILTSLLRTARLAELSSFGRIAKDRLKVLDRLDYLIDDQDTNENDLQRLIAEAPWLINPEWAPVTANQSFSSLRKEFEKYYKNKTGQPILLDNFEQPQNRPDFVLSSQERTVEIIEIKRPGHKLTNDEMGRIDKYYKTMTNFLDDPAHKEFRKFFVDCHITLVCDYIGLTDLADTAFGRYLGNEGKMGKLTHMSWAVFLLKTRQVHQDFLREAQRQRDAISPVPRSD